MKLVRESREEGYPADYLLARIRGRRTGLTTEWPARLRTGISREIGDELLWTTLLKELGWVHRQMNRALRKTFSPVFLFFELRTLVLCLRNLAAHERMNVEELLKFSLLSNEVRKALRRGLDPRGAITAVADCFVRASARFAGLDQAYAERGMRGFEETLMRNYLGHMASARLHPSVRDFFARLIDVRNLLALYKHLRWSMAYGPEFTPGGRVRVRRLKAVMMQGDPAGVERLRPRGGRTDSGSTLEISLLREVTARLRRTAREPDGVGLVLDYLWRRYIETRNLGILVHAKDADPDTLGGELIQ